jgi:NADH dehydrogenase
MEAKKVLLIGGSGFVGEWIANRLSERGMRVTIPSRHRDHCKELILLPTVYTIEADVHDPKVLGELINDADVVINLVGILHDRDAKTPYGKRFAQAHVELPQKIVAAMKAAGARPRRLLHMSALGASSNAPSGYLRSKAAGEAAVLAAAGELDVTIFRPSVIFGRGDSFLNRFATLVKLLPVLPLGGANARLQPVYVGDVADAFVAAISDASTFGKTYELTGPRVYTLRELVDYTALVVGKRALVIELPDALAYVQAGVLGLLPNPPLSPDNLRSLQVASVASGKNAWPGFSPQPLEAIAPTYLSTAANRHFDGFRGRAGR